MTRKEVTEFVNEHAVIREGKPKKILTPTELAEFKKKHNSIEWAISTEVKVGKRKARAISICRLWVKGAVGPSAEYVRADGKRNLVRLLMKDAEHANG